MIIVSMIGELILVLAPVGIAGIQNNIHQTFEVFMFILLIMACCVWLEGQLKLTPSFLGKEGQLKLTPSFLGKDHTFLQNLRQADSSGCIHGLLPLFAVLPNSIAATPESGLSKEPYIVSVMLISCFLYIFSHVNKRASKEWYVFVLLLGIADFYVLLSTLFHYGKVSVAVCVTVQCLSVAVLALTITWAGPCFTLGEAIIISQLSTLFFSRIFSGSIKDIDVTSVADQVDIFVSIVVLGVILILALLLLYGWRYDCCPGPVQFYAALLTVGFIFVLPLLYSFLHENPVVWLVFYIITDKRKLGLFLYWLVCTAIAIFTVTKSQSKETGPNPSEPLAKRPGSTVMRKYFHLLVMAVYVPGLLVDLSFLYTASVVALAVLIVLEAVRVCAIPPLGEGVKEMFTVFLDEKDEGPILLTHIYLLAGLSLPLWLSSAHSRSPADISLYSGVLSLGVGDTAASIGGTLLGRHHYPGSKKTFEGTAIAILSQLLAVLILSYFGVRGINSLLSVCVSVVLTSLLEGLTSQIDNLVLPVYMYAMLSGKPR